MELHKRWVEQCDAAEVIRERFGVRSALGYLIGEKFLNFLRDTDGMAGGHVRGHANGDAKVDATCAAELAEFVRRIREVFSRAEIDAYLREMQQPGAVDEVDRKNWDFDSFEDAGFAPTDVIDEAEEIVLLDRVRELLLD